MTGHIAKARAAIALTLAFLLVGGSVAEASELLAPKTTYIVSIDGDFNDLVRAQLLGAGIAISDEFEYASDAFVVELSDYQLSFVRNFQYVKSIEADSPLYLQAIQSPVPSWGLDRIDQRAQTTSPAVGEYEYLSGGQGATIYIGDTGVLEHQDLTGRISPSGYSSFSDGLGTRDCNGHGTHVATTAAGTSYGVAKFATIVPVRLLDCDGNASVVGVVAALDWILSPANTNSKSQAVLNLSLGGPRSAAFNDAVERVSNSGIAVVVAAGNERTDACAMSPASAPSAISVGATTRDDVRAPFSNYGSCVDINAPGTEITAGWFTSASSTLTIQGTSMAAPHVAGAVAIYRGLFPTATVTQLTSALLATATDGVITSLVSGTPNKLLYISPTDSWPGYVAPKVEFTTLDGITGTSALIRMNVNPESESTTVLVEFSSDATLATGIESATASSPEFSGSEVISTSAFLQNLSPATNYYFRLVGSNSSGSFTTPIYRFTTKSLASSAPTVTISPATNVTSFSAQLNGTITANGLATDVQILYSTTADFSSNVRTLSGRAYSQFGGSSASTLSATPISLNGETTYYFKISANNAAGYSSTEVSSFTTLAAPGLAPVVSIDDLNGLMRIEGQVISGKVHPQSQATTVIFSFATNRSFTSNTGSFVLPEVFGNIETSVSLSVSGAVPGGLYYFRFDATNSSGKTIGNVIEVRAGQPEPTPTPEPTPEPTPTPEPDPIPPVVTPPPATPEPPIVFTPPAPVPAPVPAPAPAPAPAPVPAPAPAPPVASAPSDGDRDEEQKEDSETAVIPVLPVLVEEPAVPGEVRNQESKSEQSVVVEERIVIRIAALKVPSFRGVGPFTFSLGVREKASATTINDPDIASGVRVTSQTPAICRVISTFDRKSGRYAVSVKGISNGNCRITAIDSGSDTNFPAMTEIKQQISGIAPKRSIKQASKKPPATQSGVTKASFKPKR